MDDRTLLEMAAKAAGMRVLVEGEKWPRDNIGWFFCERGDGGALFDRSTPSLTKWDPLTDDGDALRLAVKLGLRVFTPDTEPTAVADRYPSGPRAGVDASDDPCAATRRAIVRAAAEIGKSRVSAPGAVEGGNT